MNSIRRWIPLLVALALAATLPPAPTAAQTPAQEPFFDGLGSYQRKGTVESKGARPHLRGALALGTQVYGPARRTRAFPGWPRSTAALWPMSSPPQPSRRRVAPAQFGRAG